MVIPVHRHHDAEKRLSVGMDRTLLTQLREEFVGPLASHFQPERIRAEVEFARPSEGPAPLANCRLAEEGVVCPWSKDSLADMGSEIRLALHAIIEAQPNSVVLQHVAGNYLLHFGNLAAVLAPSKLSLPRCRARGVSTGPRRSH